VRQKHSMTNLYETLGVTYEASTEEIEKSYKRLCSFFDKATLEENPGMKIYFDDISIAYRTLVNSESRAEYDEYIS